MNRRPLYASLVLSLLVVGALAASLAGGTTPQLGLDLEGGISAIYVPDLSDVGADQDPEQVLDQTVEIIRNRVDSLGVAEPEIARQGDQILVQLPGIEDENRVQEIIGRTAKLTFRRVQEVIPPASPAYEETPPCEPVDPEGADDEDGGPELADGEGGVLCERPDQSQTPETPIKYRVGPAKVQGSAIEQAFSTIGNGGFVVSLELNDQGATRFQEVTADLACERDVTAGVLGPEALPEGIDQAGPGLFAIVLDGQVFSAPGINEGVACGAGIAGGQAQITVGGEEQEAQDLALVLRTGSLPVSLEEPSEFRTVSPTLGAESLQAGLLAAGIGLALVALYLIGFYRWLGVVGISALAVFGVVITGLIGLFGSFGFTLTLAGIAGIVVSIGITADSSILFFERIRDEVRLGKTVRTSVRRAFQSAFRTNLAGNTVTLAAAIVLYFLAVGPVRGFALTLGIATVLDIAILWGFTRPVVYLISTTRLLRRDNLRVEPRGGAAKEVTS